MCCALKFEQQGGSCRRMKCAVGHCGDNAACEGLFGMLKRKRIYRTKYPTLDAARTDLISPVSQP
ncbi:hypothetical protein KOJCDNHJ_02753 [Xanthomonas citri pv. punicae]|nr:hypothetical protein KOJCDNHJ_02753 [Xanthomonas citri pv. punicae]